MSTSPVFFAGLDIGGTTVKSVLVDGEGELVGEMVEVRSLVKNGYEATFAQLESDLPLLMKKVDSFIAEATATAAGTRKTLESFEETMASVRKTLDSEAFLKLPSDLRDSLTAFQKTASSLEKTANC